KQIIHGSTNSNRSTASRIDPITHSPSPAVYTHHNQHPTPYQSDNNNITNNNIINMNHDGTMSTSKPGQLQQRLPNSIGISLDASGTLKENTLARPSFQSNPQSYPPESSLDVGGAI